MLIMVGIPGSGKSTFAHRFASMFNAPFVDYDLIMDIAGGNGDVSDVYAGYLLKELFKTQHTIVFDGPTATRAERLALKDLAASAGYKSVFIWVQTDEATAKSRFVKSHHRSGQNASTALYDSLMARFTPPLPKEHSLIVISGKHTYATQARAVLKNLTMAKQQAREGTTIRTHSSLTARKGNITVRQDG